jgi:hypothetical protein
MTFQSSVHKARPGNDMLNMLGLKKEKCHTKKKRRIEKSLA